MTAERRYSPKRTQPRATSLDNIIRVTWWQCRPAGGGGGTTVWVANSTGGHRPHDEQTGGQPGPAAGGGGGRRRAAQSGHWSARVMLGLQLAMLGHRYIQAQEGIDWVSQGQARPSEVRHGIMNGQIRSDNARRDNLRVNWYN